jgi:hypothetical protein
MQTGWGEPDTAERSGLEPATGAVDTSDMVAARLRAVRPRQRGWNRAQAYRYRPTDDWIRGQGQRLVPACATRGGPEQVVLTLRQSGLSYAEIVEDLKRSGVRNRDGRPLTEAVIGGRLRSLGW